MYTYNPIRLKLNGPQTEPLYRPRCKESSMRVTRRSGALVLKSHLSRIIFGSPGFRVDCGCALLGGPRDTSCLRLHFFGYWPPLGTNMERASSETFCQQVVLRNFPVQGFISATKRHDCGESEPSWQLHCRQVACRFCERPVRDFLKVPPY